MHASICITTQELMDIWQIEASVDGDAGDAGVASRRHGRVLGVPADDYARYDPSPTMNKPHFKDIPN
jgi:hypothetical protein